MKFRIELDENQAYKKIMKVDIFNEIREVTFILYGTGRYHKIKSLGLKKITAEIYLSYF